MKIYHDEDPIHTIKGRKMNIQKEFNYIDNYFKNIDKNKLINDLIACGLPKPKDLDVKVYNTKYWWHRILPFWLLKLFVKPTVYKDCYIKSIGNMQAGEDVISIPTTFSYDKVEQ